MATTVNSYILINYYLSDFEEKFLFIIHNK